MAMKTEDMLKEAGCSDEEAEAIISEAVEEWLEQWRTREIREWDLNVLIAALATGFFDDDPEGREEADSEIIIRQNQ